MKKGFFITFEGTEGAGKSTQIKRLAVYLRRRGKKVLFLREPGGTKISEAIRSILLNKQFKEMTPETELLLYLAARAQMVRDKIEPALRKGITVICDRYEDSTLAYQGYGRGLDKDLISKISSFVRRNIVPDLTFILDIDPAKGMKRGGRHDRMERESLKFHQKVRRGFLALAYKNPRRCYVLDTTQSKDEVTEIIQNIIERKSNNASLRARRAKQSGF